MTRYKRFEDIPNEAELHRYNRLARAIIERAEAEGVTAITDQDLDDLAVTCPTDAQNLRRQRREITEAAKHRRRATPHDPLDMVVTARDLINTLRHPKKPECHFVRVKDVQHNLAPVFQGIRERLDALETRDGTDLPTRSAAMPADEVHSLRSQIKGLEVELAFASKTTQDLHERVAELSARPSLQYRGVFESGETYQVGDFVTWDGSCWACKASGRRGAPGKDLAGWQMAVRRGARQKDHNK